MFINGDIAVRTLVCLIFASIAQLVERPLSEQEFVGSNLMAAPYQRWKMVLAAPLLTLA